MVTEHVLDVVRELVVNAVVLGVDMRMNRVRVVEFLAGRTADVFQFSD